MCFICKNEYIRSSHPVVYLILRVTYAAFSEWGKTRNMEAEKNAGKL